MIEETEECCSNRRTGFADVEILYQQRCSSCRLPATWIGVIRRIAQVSSF